jgi:6-pyruvoyltetrahydropterin/6-carboxytetrahydropterin synthase
MFEVEITASFSAAHRLREYHGKCEHLHGHNYKVLVAARSGTLGTGGMLIDFTLLKRAANTVLEKLDHTFLNEMPPFDKIEPSAENIAAYLFSQFADILGDKSDLLYSVSVWESDTSRATYYRDAI